MKTTTKNIVSASVAAVMMGGASLAHAADSVNVAFFLEWATPNQIAKLTRLMTTPWVLTSNGQTFQQAFK